jgi:hypothetical protein
MPFKSKAQQRFMFAHKKELAKQGVDVDEWASKTDFKHLPEKKSMLEATAYLKLAAELSTEAREELPKKEFALPGGRYPIPDAAHARNALARVSQHGTPDEKATVRAKVHSKYPEIGKESSMQLLATEIVKKADYGMPGQAGQAPWYKSPALAALLGAGAGGATGMALSGHSPMALADLFTPGDDASYSPYGNPSMGRPEEPQINLDTMPQGHRPELPGSYDIGGVTGGYTGPQFDPEVPAAAPQLHVQPTHGFGNQQLPPTWMQQHPQPGM